MKRVPVEQLVDVGALYEDGRPPSLPKLRAALPRGWVLEADGVTARRDMRVMFREGWLLASGLVLFGAAGALFFYEVFPRGWSGVLRVVLLLGAVVVVAGVVAPGITRAIYRR